jgi:hypothetical protein
MNVDEAVDLAHAAEHASRERLAARVAALEAALEALLDNHVQLVSSGDRGFWNAEDEPEVQAARAVLAATKKEN